MRMQLWPMDTLPSSSVGVVIVGQQLLQLGGVPLGQLWAPVVQRRRVLEQHDPPTAGMLLGDERLHGVDGCIQRALARRHHPDPGPEYDGASPERPQGAHLGDVRGGGVISEDRGQVVKDLRAAAWLPSYPIIDPSSANSAAKSCALRQFQASSSRA